MAGSIRKVENIIVPSEKAKIDYYWIKTDQGQSYAVTYLINHPSFLQKKLGIKVRLAGVEVAIPDPPRKSPPKADLIYLSPDGRHYFVFEAKEKSSRIKKAERDAKDYAELLKKHLDDSNIPYTAITPVALVVSD